MKHSRKKEKRKEGSMNHLRQSLKERISRAINQSKELQEQIRILGPIRPCSKRWIMPNVSSAR